MRGPELVPPLPMAGSVPHSLPTLLSPICQETQEEAKFLLLKWEGPCTGRAEAACHPWRLSVNIHEGLPTLLVGWERVISSQQGSEAIGVVVPNLVSLVFKQHDPLVKPDF